MDKLRWPDRVWLDEEGEWWSLDYKDNGAVEYVKADAIERLERERDESRKYLAAAAADYTRLLDYLEKAYTESDQPLPFEDAFAGAARECRETSEFLKAASEGRDVSAVFDDELTKSKDEATTLRARVAKMEEALREARSGLCAYTGGAGGACEDTILRIDIALTEEPAA